MVQHHVAIVEKLFTRKVQNLTFHTVTISLAKVTSVVKKHDSPEDIKETNWEEYKKRNKKQQQGELMAEAKEKERGEDEQE